MDSVCRKLREPHPSPSLVDLCLPVGSAEPGDLSVLLKQIEAIKVFSSRALATFNQADFPEIT